ncbi:MAG: histidine phosphatase family protein [Candidatus Nanopelagicales bacterium]|jgi:phosphohistidine phosphatase|nr:histidine phosphatase family protein [Candidatus Nanopelagicales bacterium]MDP4714992.1 histidine phosphatase family protein [Candidatus Nanopelagicales bacterium]MDP4906498.1 histidine phosphatase family protein [Candidatus Nanopelagicales bacterium]MDP4975864.1 histidine phosphatase family protein [Candidatus Nanopelagicales bacterium]MDP5096052.1 histidine phosphatase family protein [Candidatus Nanopelagicales bacterium]
MPTLILMRHAKSDYPPGVIDRERPLSARGERDADSAGRWMQAMYPQVDVVLLSPAVRAQQTWARVGPHIVAGQIRTEPVVYDDWGSGLSHLITSTVDASAHRTLVVGHNPGIEDVAQRWSAEGSDVVRDGMLRKYPTCGIAVINLTSGWQGPGELLTFTVPRG